MRPISALLSPYGIFGDTVQLFIGFPILTVESAESRDTETTKLPLLSHSPSVPHNPSTFQIADLFKSGLDCCWSAVRQFGGRGSQGTPCACWDCSLEGHLRHSRPQSCDDDRGERTRITYLFHFQLFTILVGKTTFERGVSSMVFDSRASHPIPQRKSLGTSPCPDYKKG